MTIYLDAASGPGQRIINLIDQLTPVLHRTAMLTRIVHSGDDGYAIFFDDQSYVQVSDPGMTGSMTRIALERLHRIALMAESTLVERIGVAA